MKRRHVSERVFYPDTDDVSSTSKVVARSIAVFRFNVLTKPYDFFPVQRFNASTLQRIPGTPKPWRRRHVATASLIRTADQARGKVGGVKWTCAYRGGRSSLTRRGFSGGGGEERNDFLIHPFYFALSSDRGFFGYKKR
jgi:hypothetical protein